MQSSIISRGDTGAQIEWIQKQFGNTPYESALWYRPEGKSNCISIDQIRAFKKDISVHPGVPLRLYIFQDAQSLTVEAQQALLKIVEEPPIYAQILFLVDHEENLLQTIRSRCIVHALSDVSHSPIEATVLAECAELIQSDIGKRIDWVTAHKNELRISVYAQSICDGCVVLCRNLILKKIGVVEATKDDGKNTHLLPDIPDVSMTEIEHVLRMSQEMSRKIVAYNLNLSLAVESMLISLPEWYTQNTKDSEA